MLRKIIYSPMLWRVIYSPPEPDYVPTLPEVTETTSTMGSSFTDYFSMPKVTMPAMSMPTVTIPSSFTKYFSMPTFGMPESSMPTISAPSISLPKLSFPSLSPLTLPSFKEHVPSSPFVPFLLILLILSLTAYILHTYLITPRKSPRDAAFDAHDPLGPPARLNFIELQERCRAQARRDYVFGRLSGEPSHLQQWRAGVVAQPVGAQRVDVPELPRPWVPARPPTPWVSPVLTESPVPMMAVQENPAIVVQTASPVQENQEIVGQTAARALSTGFLALMVKVVSLRRSTRVKKAPVRFDEMDFPSGRRM